MTEPMNSPFGGTAVAEPPVAMQGPFDDAPADDGNRRKLIVVGAAVTAVVVVVAAFFLLKGGGSSNDAAVPPVHHTTHKAAAAPAAKAPAKPVTLPKKYAAPVGRDPFKALYTAPTTTTTAGGTSTSTTGGTTTATTGGTGTTATTGTTGSTATTVGTTTGTSTGTSSGGTTAAAGSSRTPTQSTVQFGGSFPNDQRHYGVEVWVGSSKKGTVYKVGVGQTFATYYQLVRAFTTDGKTCGDFLFGSSTFTLCSGDYSTQGA